MYYFLHSLPPPWQNNSWPVPQYTSDYENRCQLEIVPIKDLDSLERRYLHVWSWVGGTRNTTNYHCLYTICTGSQGKHNMKIHLLISKRGDLEDASNIRRSADCHPTVIIYISSYFFYVVEVLFRDSTVSVTGYFLHWVQS